MSDLDVVDRLNMYYGDQFDKTVTPRVCPGNFINIGYWKNLPKSGFISEGERLESHKELYRILLETLQIQNSDKLLEIACGRGGGCTLALNEFEPAEVHGIDIMPHQIERSKSQCNHTARENTLVYQLGSATDIPYGEATFDKIFSLEALLYFSDIDLFANELFRVAKKPARIAVACIFSTSSDVRSDDWIHLFDKSGTGRGYSVSHLEDALARCGFTDIQHASIGEDLWFGYRNWAVQLYPNSSLPDKWCKGYTEGVFDYYIINANVAAN